MKKKALWIGITFVSSVILVILVCYLIVDFNASGRTFDKVEDVSEHEYGLLLGTSPITPQGAHNFYFDNRIKAAVELYKAGKIKRIIVSGGDYCNNEDGTPRENGCNELRSMCDSLVQYGVPYDALTLDYDGTRTLNSIVKVKDVYGIDSCVIISQQYHNERAIYQADHYRLKAVGYNATPSHTRQNRIKNQVRELFARVKLFIDLVIGKKPKFTSYAIASPSGQLQNWYDEPDSVPGVQNSCGHRSNDDSKRGYYKYFSTFKGKPFYYNSRHGFYVLLPEGMGYNQSGENMMGAHSNEFYNADTTLVVSVGASFYDVVLVDNPNYVETLKLNEKKFMTQMRNHTTRQLTPDIWISEGRINHVDPENPPADRYLRKWLLKKDIAGRECEMSLTIYFNDTLANRIQEFENIINQFPNLPKLK